MTRFVIFSPTEGVYLGSAMGLGFWSKLDPVGQNAAVTFASPSEATECIRSWEPGSAPLDIRFRTVECGGPVEAGGVVYATIPEIVAADMPAWNPNANPARAS